MKIKNNKNFYTVLLFLSFFVVNFILLYNHDLWRDEAQSWLLVRELNFIDLIKQLKYEGHPFLWYLVLKPFVMLGLSYKLSFLIPFIISNIAVFIYLKKTNFNNLVNFIFLFSSAVLCKSTVFVRSYCLCFLLMVLLMVFYKDRKTKPIFYGFLLLLLANTHILMFGFVCCLILTELYDIYVKKNIINKKKRLIGTGIAIFGLLLVFLQLFGSLGASHVDWNSRPFLINFKILTWQLLQVFSFSCGNSNFAFFALCAFLYQIYYFIKHNKYTILFILLGSIGFQLLVFVFIYNIVEYMSCLFVFIFFFCVYIFYEECSNKEKYLCWDIMPCLVVLLLSFPFSITYVINSFKYDNTSSYDTAMYIKANISINEKLYCTNAPVCTSLIPYLDDYKFINLNTMEEFIYMDWTPEKEFSEALTKDNYKEIIENKDIKYFINTYNETDNKYLKKLKQQNKVKLIFSDLDMIMTDEVYEIYEVL